jgi:hypothetical protein
MKQRYHVTDALAFDVDDDDDDDDGIETGFHSGSAANTAEPATTTGSASATTMQAFGIARGIASAYHACA